MLDILMKQMGIDPKQIMETIDQFQKLALESAARLSDLEGAVQRIEAKLDKVIDGEKSDGT